MGGIDIFLKKHGKNDGKDEERFEYACILAQEIDRHVEIVFKSMITLEEKGVIKLNIEHTNNE